MKRRVLLAGGSGFIGRALGPFLQQRGYEVALLTRATARAKNGIAFVNWDGQTLGDWVAAVDGTFALVNLSGKSINCRHTAKNRREIIDSRVASVRVLGQAMARCAEPPRVFVQATAIGIYGDKGERWCDEETAPGDDFVARVCQQWEAAVHEIVVPRTRKVLLRLGVVLGRDAGFLKVLGRVTKAFLGGHVGHGRQYISWIHLADLLHIFLASIERDEMIGAFNATSPNPVTNAEFMRELRRALHRPWSPPVPKFAARLGSWLIGTEAELAFASQRGTPAGLLANGFHFAFPELPAALADIYSQA